MSAAITFAIVFRSMRSFLTTSEEPLKKHFFAILTIVYINSCISVYYNIIYFTKCSTRRFLVFSSGNKKRRFPASFLFVCGHRFLKERFLKSVFGWYRQLFTASAAACGQYAAAIGGGHAFPESVFVTAFTLRRLECAFHIMTILWFSIGSAKVAF